MLAGSMLVAALVCAPPPLEVTTRGERCASAELSERIARYLEVASADTSTPPSVDAELRREDEGLWRLDLRVPADGAVRTFRAASCATVVDAAAFVVAVAIDPTVADAIAGPEWSEPAPKLEPKPEPEPAPEPEPPSPVPVPVPVPVPPKPVPVQPEGSRPIAESTSTTAPASSERSPSPLAFVLGAHAGIEGGALPRVGALVRLDVGVLAPRWRVDARGQFRTPSEARASADREAGGNVSAWAIGLRGCGLPKLETARLDIPLCAGAEAGQVLARGFGFPGAQATSLPWVALTVGPALTWAIRPRLALVVTAEIGAALLGGRLVIENLETVHDIGVVFGRGTIGLEGRFRGRSGA